MARTHSQTQHRKWFHDKSTWTSKSLRKTDGYPGLVYLYYGYYPAVWVKPSHAWGNKKYRETLFTPPGISWICRDLVLYYLRFNEIPFKASGNESMHVSILVIITAPAQLHTVTNIGCPDNWQLWLSFPINFTRLWRPTGKRLYQSAPVVWLLRQTFRIKELALLFYLN